MSVLIMQSSLLITTESLWHYTPTPYEISVARTETGIDFYRSDGYVNGSISVPVTWSNDDYVVLAVSSVSPSISAPTGMTQIATKKHDATTLYAHVFGGKKSDIGSAINFTVGTAGAWAAAATAISGIDVSGENVVSWSDFSGWGAAKDLIKSKYSTDTDGKFSVSLTFSDNNEAVSGDRTYMPSSAMLVSRSPSSVWENVMRQVAVVPQPVAEGLDTVNTPYAISTQSVQYAIAGSLILERKSGVRPTLTPDFAGMDAALAAMAGTRGYMWIAYKNGEVYDSKASGWARTPSESVNPSLPMSLDLVVPTASVSKVVTELVVRKLVERGDFALDDKLSDLLSGVSFGSNTGNVTVRQLLQMTSGISANYTLDGAYPSTVQAWLGNSSTNRGEKYFYQNGNFAALQLVIEQQTGEEFAELAQSLVFQPLGITTATIAPQTNGVLMYNASGAGVAPFVVPASSVGGFCMSLNDMGRLLAATRYDVILGDSSLNQMLNDRYRMIAGLSKRAEHHWHNGALTWSGGYELNTLVFRGSDGFDVAIFINMPVATALDRLVKNAMDAGL